MEKYLTIVMRKSDQSRPIVLEQQAITSMALLKVLVKNIFPAKRDIVIIMADKTYLTLDSNDWQGTDYFTFPSKEVGVTSNINPTQISRRMSFSGWRLVRRQCPSCCSFLQGVR